MKQRKISRREMFAYTGALIASAAGLGVLDKLSGYTGPMTATEVRLCGAQMADRLQVYVDGVLQEETDYILSKVNHQAWAIDLREPAINVTIIQKMPYKQSFMG